MFKFLSSPTTEELIKAHEARFTNYGMGVWYFEFIGREFAKQLSVFLSHNSKLSVVSMTGDGNGGYGADRGYIVVFQQKE